MAQGHQSHTGFDRGSEHWKRLSSLTVLLKYLCGLREIAGFTWTMQCTASSVRLIGSIALEPRIIKYSSCFCGESHHFSQPFSAVKLHRISHNCATDLPHLLYSCHGQFALPHITNPGFFCPESVVISDEPVLAEMSCE